MPDRHLDRPHWRRSGIEHEFSLFRGDEQVDARVLLPTLDLGGRRLDPGDPRAVRCDWGGVITADGMEIELATPPTTIGGHGLGAALHLAAVGQSRMRAGLPHDLRVMGYSTHLNVEIRERRARRTALTVARHFGPAIGLLLDRADSPGLLVRPRHRRMELGGEYADGDTLRAAWLFTIGAVVAAEAAVHTRRAVLPPRLQLALRPTPERFGWFVGRTAGGPDLYAAPRTALLRTADGRTITGQQMLQAAWAAARPHVAEVASMDDLAIVDDRVSGRVPLPCEAPAADAAPAEIAYELPSPIDQRIRAGVTVVPVAATWHAMVLRIERAGRERWVQVPGEEADDFLAGLDRGDLDDWLDALLPAGEVRA